MPSWTLASEACRKVPAEEISAEPPAVLPRASMPPRKVVWTSDHTTAVPPSPLAPETLIVVPSLTKVWPALAIGASEPQRPRKES